jgi:hypothetical protein
MSKSMLNVLSMKFKVVLLMGLIQISSFQIVAADVLNTTNIPAIRETIILTYPYKISADKINNFSFNNINKKDDDGLKHIESNEKLFENKFNYLNNGNYTQEISHSNDTLNFDINKTNAILSTSKIYI